MIGTEKNLTYRNFEIPRFHCIYIIENNINFILNLYYITNKEIIIIITISNLMKH